jgi:uncharacterized FAD-dependent dehydrogenase
VPKEPYSGGIVSAAIDGQNIVAKIFEEFELK